MKNFFKQLVNKCLFITRVWELSGQDRFVVFKHFVELSDSVLEDGEEVGEAEVGDLNLKQMLRTWVGSSRRESLRAELKVVTFTLLLVTSILNDIETSMVVLLFCNFHM